MSIENSKIDRIKKSCRIGRTACSVLRILCAVGAIGAFVGFVLVLAARGQVGVFGTSPLIDDGGLGVVSWELTREDFDEIGIFANFIPQSADDLLKIALVSLYTAVIAGLTALLFHLFGQVFVVILNEESPFTEGVLKKLKINFILLAAVILFTTGFGPAVAAVFLFWCVYNIFDYGCILQQDADETL